MTATTTTNSAAIDARRPLAPPPAIRVLDRVLHVRPTMVVSAGRETPTVLALEVERPAGFRQAAGQFALVRLDTEDGPDFRPLSIASAPGESTLRFGTREGPSPFKRAFAELAPGDVVKVSRPMGTFGLDLSRPAVFVAGGIGITPVRSMLVHAAAVGHELPRRLLYGSRSVDEIAYRAELEDLARADPALEIQWVVERRIDEELLGESVDAFRDARFYVTGPAAMVAGIEASLGRLGVPRRRIHHSKQTLPIDRFSSARRMP